MKKYFYDAISLSICHSTPTPHSFPSSSDGYSRVITCLTYLNGVAGTWFPFANEPTDLKDNVSTIQNLMKNNSAQFTKQKKKPGIDGICIVGETENDNEDVDDNQHFVKVKQGDAVVFYNYDYNADDQKLEERWKSLHCGLPASYEKWIATNWFCV